MKSSRRSFLKETTTGLVVSALAGCAVEPDEHSFPIIRDVSWQPTGSPPGNVTRTWLGPEFWANRLQDWRLHEGWIECLSASAPDEVRTAALLTREIVPGRGSAHLSVLARLVEDKGEGGFCGFLVGAGEGQLDYRAAALVQRASGLGGGMLCVFKTDGRASFLEHSSERDPLAYSKISAETASARRSPQVRLQLDVVPELTDTFEVRFSAWDPSSEQFLTGTIRRGVPERELLGGIALVSSPSGSEGARFAFRDVLTFGEKIRDRSERALGPVLGTLFSLNGNVLKLSAQFLPVGDSEPQVAELQFRAPGGAWQSGPTERLQPGFVVLFRLDNWNASFDMEYRVLYPADAAQPDAYEGTIPRDPRDKDVLTVAHFSCTKATGRSLESGVGKPELPKAELLGRYTAKNIYFPHADVVRNAGSHNPDLLVFAGDQLYEGSPTRRDRSPSPMLDYLYKWFLWVWSFRELTRGLPAIIQIDDHDVYHGNLWGEGGKAVRTGSFGGYLHSGEFVNLVQRTQCGHNPDPYDSTPVDQGITVYYGVFAYGDVSFAILEDRKFKSGPPGKDHADVGESVLLGERQERFLEAWARDSKDAAARICLTQTAFAALQTTQDGKPARDFDANGYPKPGRDRAIELLRRARALVLSGDQHLATVVRHGLDTFTDGVVQFTGPAAGSSWQRWFEPADPLPNATTLPFTGDFTDAFGNKLRVLAVANPKVSFTEYRKTIKGDNQNLNDRRLKSEGYGIVRVDRKAREFAIECWPWNVDPTTPDARQFPGWPFRLPFDKVTGE